MQRLVLSALCALTLVLTSFTHEWDNPIPFDEKSGKYAYIAVVETPGVAPADAYTAAKNWLVQKHVNSEFNIETPAKQLADHGSFAIQFKAKGSKMLITQHILYDVIVDFKDGRCRYKITNIKISGNGEGTTAEYTLEGWVKMDESLGVGKKMLQQNIENSCAGIHENLSAFAAELTDALQGKQQDDDW